MESAFENHMTDTAASAQFIYINVAVSLPVTETYTYSAPLELAGFATPGKRVLVPFGRQRVTGYILEQCAAPPLDSVRQILDILDEIPLFPQSMPAFFKWIAAYYMHPVGQVIQCALPAGLNFKDISLVRVTDEGRKALADGGLSFPEQESLDYISQRPRRLKEILSLPGQNITHAFLHAMARKGWLAIEKTLIGNSARPKMEKFVTLCNPDLPINPRASVQKLVLSALKTKSEISVSDLKTLIPTAAHVLSPLIESGHIAVVEKTVYRDPFGDLIPPDIPPSLTHEQDQVIREIIGSLGKGYATFLLSGVTGSGKTEVYMRLAAETLHRGLKVLILVPEIALISQVERRFRARFGEQIGVLHSGLSKGERYDQWIRILENRASVVVGARSAVFAPMERIGLIIVDEEHDASYKQDHGLMYNGRDLAVKRADLEGSVVVLGSATPSVQSYYNVETGKYKEVTLTQRIENRPLPDIRIVDLRENRGTRGIRKFMSPLLIQSMEETLAKKEQILLFINRRGFSSLSVCGACDQPIVCRNCDIPLTLHLKTNAHRCHYCGFSRATAVRCPICGSEDIRHLGMGTEKIESAVSKLFPDARIARMDRDTALHKGAILKILKDLKNRSIDILIGTQMVAKGHDFPHITLAGIICADLSLSFPDFRSGARTFQLLAQVAGRAGRGNVPGRVILQTYNPDHFAVSSAKTQDFRVFYQQDIQFRKSLGYPPITRLMLLRISGKESAETQEHAEKMEAALQTLKSDRSYSERITVLGPTPSLMYKMANRYRWQILIKGRESRSLHHFMNRFCSSFPMFFQHQRVKVAIDVDPIFMM